MSDHPSFLVRQAAVLGLAVGVFGVSFGVLASASGLPWPMACAMSLLVFAGGSQFAAVAVVAAGGSPAAAVLSGLLLNARYLPFGLAVAPSLRGGLLRRAVAAQLVIDESSALALAQEEHHRERAFWLAGGAVFLLWNLGTLLGALVGQGLGDPKALGLDAAFPAGFLALLAPLLRTPAAKRAALTGAIIAVALAPLTPPGVPVFAAAAGALAGVRRIGTADDHAAADHAADDRAADDRAAAAAAAAAEADSA